MELYDQFSRELEAFKIRSHYRISQRTGSISYVFPPSPKERRGSLIPEQIAPQFVPIVLQGSRIYVPSLCLLFKRRAREDQRNATPPPTEYNCEGENPVFEITQLYRLSKIEGIISAQFFLNE